MNERSHLFDAGSVPERRLTLAMALIGVALASVCAGLAGVPWAEWQWAIVLFFAFDLVGGVAAMAMGPAIRKIRPVNQPLRPLIFAAFHVHPMVLALVLPEVSWVPLVALYAICVGAVAIAIIARPVVGPGVALGTCAVGLAIIALLGMPAGLEWFAPAYLLKLAGSFAVRPPEPASAR